MAPENMPAGKSQNTAMAIVAYILFFVPMLTGDSKKDPFVGYHTRQGFGLFLFAFLINVIGWIVPWYYSMWYTISYLLGLCVLVLLIVGISNVTKGKQQPLPVLGKMFETFKI